MKNRGLLVILATAILLTLSPLSRADGVEVTVSNVSGAAGSTVEVLGTITNGTDATINLNGDSFSLSDSAFGLDDTDFYINAPLFLAAGASSGPFDIFAIQISPSAATGLSGPNFFSVLGGPDGGTFDLLGTATFNVDVEGAPSVPEPSGTLLLLCGIAALVIVRSRMSRLGSPAPSRLRRIAGSLSSITNAK
jgi:hypothetical protein